MSALARLARAVVVAAARRWPADLSEIMAQEWQAELDTIRTDPSLGRPARARRTIAFAGSLALSPAVEEAGTQPVTRLDRAAAVGRAAAVTLVAAALFNAVHLTYHHMHLAPAGAIGVLAVAALIMVALAGRRGTPHPIRTTALIGLAMYGFLLAGNRVAVMPFMGWVDILPAVAIWTMLTAATAVIATRLVAADRRRLAVLVAAAGGLITLDFTAIAGSVHAAGVLGIGLGSSSFTWLPLALLPGGTATFGAYFADGTATFGSLQVSGSAFHASTILLGNASAMVGPLALSSVYLLTRVVRTGIPQTRNLLHQRSAPEHRRPIAGFVARISRTRFDPRIPLAAGAAALAIAAGELIRRSSGTVDATLHRMLDNSNVFGFGFLAGMPGRIAVALLVGLLIAHAGESTRHSATN